MNYDEQIINIKNSIERAQSKRDTALGRMETLKQQREKIIQEIIDAGSSPETIEKDIADLENQIQNLIRECNELLPKDI